MRQFAYLAALAGAAALAGCGVATTTSATGSGALGLPEAQLVSIAQGMAAGLGAPHLETAWVIATRKNAAEHATTPGAVPPDPANPRAYLIVIYGRFVCDDCSAPPTAKLPRGRVAYDIWVPGRGVSDFGLVRRLPRAVHRLGPMMKVRLVPPPIPARELALRPGSGIGPVRLGTRVRALNRTIGPAISPGQYVFGPIAVDIHAHHGRVDRVIVLSARATIDGHPFSDGYERLRRELVGWTTLDCPAGPRVLFRRSVSGVSTRLEFTGDRFDQVFIGRARPATCSAPFPRGQLSDSGRTWPGKPGATAKKARPTWRPRSSARPRGRTSRRRRRAPARTERSPSSRSKHDPIWVARARRPPLASAERAREPAQAPAR